MKRVLALLLSATMVLSLAACSSHAPKAPTDIIHSSAQIQFNSDSSSDMAETESPDPNEEIVPSSSSSKPTSSSSKPASSSSKPASSSSKPASSSSKPASSSSEPTSSSSKPASSEAETPKDSSSMANTYVKPDTGVSQAPRDEMRAIWLSYLDFNTLLKGKTESEFTKNMERAMGKASADGYNTVFMQVRPFGDALYKSSFFPWSHTITGTEGEDPGFDPLKIVIDCARNYGMGVEAWINPYRIRTSGVKASLAETSLAYEWLRDDSGEVIEYDGGIYFNPANEYARNLIVSGVGELVEKYSIVGVHFDDYFYPTTDAAFDAKYYKQYKNGGGKLSLAAWRRDNVNKLVKDTYSEIKHIDRGVRFGISPQGNNDINYNDQYIDVEMWLKNPGYVDYICPQIYYGFDNETCPYSETVAYWNSIIKRDDIDLYVGLSASKIGTEDKWAGKSGIDEWQNSSDMLKRMVMQARRSSNYQGFAVFRYNSIYAPDSSVSNRVAQERSNLKGILK